MVSVARGTFDAKESNIARQKEEQEEARAKMIKHNHDFTETTAKQYSSAYNSTFNRNIDPASLHQGLTGDQLRQKVVELRKSSVILGADHKPMLSVSKADFKPKHGEYIPPANDNVAIRRTNFILGDNQTNYTTVTADYYVPQELPKDNYALFEALKVDLRGNNNLFLALIN